MPPQAGDQDFMDTEDVAEVFGLKDDFSTPVLIRPGLFLGSVAAERSLETLQRSGITHVMQVRQLLFMLASSLLGFMQWCAVSPGTQMNTERHPQMPAVLTSHVCLLGREACVSQGRICASIIQGCVTAQLTLSTLTLIHPCPQVGMSLRPRHPDALIYTAVRAPDSRCFDHHRRRRAGADDLSNRIDARFGALKAEGRAAFIAYVMAGDPDRAASLEILRGLPEAGADIIELGFPFSDPMAEGVPIQRAAQRALAGGMRLRGTTSWCATSVKVTTPRRSC